MKEKSDSLKLFSLIDEKENRIAGYIISQE